MEETCPRSQGVWLQKVEPRLGPTQCGPNPGTNFQAVVPLTWSRRKVMHLATPIPPARAGRAGLRRGGPDAEREDVGSSDIRWARGHQAWGVRGTPLLHSTETLPLIPPSPSPALPCLAWLTKNRSVVFPAGV